MARHRPPSSNHKSRAYYNALCWQVERYLLNLPDRQLARIIRPLTHEEIELLWDRIDGELEGLLARYLDDEQLLAMPDDEHHYFTPQRLATLKQIREKILALGFDPPTVRDRMDARNKRCQAELKERLKRLGRPDRQEQQVEQKDPNEELAEEMLGMLSLLPDATLRAFIDQLDEYQRVLLTRWASDGTKGVVYRLLPQEEIIELETYPVGPKRESELYAELAGFYELLKRLDPKPATGKKREQLLKRKERLGKQVEKAREKRERQAEQKRMREGIPVVADLELLTRQQLAAKLLHTNLLCRRHAVHDEEYRDRPELNLWLTAAVKREKNLLTRWALQVLQRTADPATPPQDTRQAVRQRKFDLLTEFCNQKSFSGKKNVLTWSEKQALLNNGPDCEPANLIRPSFDAYSYQQFLQKLLYWEEICTSKGPEELSRLIEQELSPLLRTVLAVAAETHPLAACLPILLENFRNQLQDKHELLLAFARRNSSSSMENPHSMENLHDLMLDTHQKLHFRRIPGIARLNSCRYAPLRHLRLQGGLDTLSRLQVCCKVLAFLYHYRKHGTASTQPLVDASSPFFKNCFQATIDYCEGGRGKYRLADRLEQIADEQCALLEANCRAAAALFPWIGPWYDPQRYAEERARYGNPEPAAQPDSRYSLEQFTPMELAARIEAYNRICSGKLPYLMLELSPLDLRLPPDTPTDQEQVPFLYYLVTMVVDGGNPRELDQAMQTALPIMARQFREKARYVTWGLSTYFEHGPALLETVYRYCLEK